MQRAGLSEHVRMFNLNLGVILQGLDSLIGSYINNDKNVGKTVADVIPKERVGLDWGLAPLSRPR